MLPKPIRAIFYWILRSGALGRLIADGIAWCFYFYVKIFNVPPQKDVAGLTVISHTHKFIFFGIPKVASRSFYNFFITQNKTAFDVEWYEKRDAFFDAVAAHPDYFKFSFTRNPWSRIVSCYNSKVADNIIGKRARILSFYKGLKGGMAFDDFIHWLNTPEGQDDIADRHWISQHAFLCDKNGAMICDFVGKYETLDADWEAVCAKIGIVHQPLTQKGFISAQGVTANPEGKSDNNVPAQRTNYKDMFDDETCEAIGTRYAKDIKMFGYSYDE